MDSAFLESKEKEFNGKQYSKLIERANQHMNRVRNSRREWEIRSYVNLMYAQSNHWVNDKGLIDVKDTNQLRRSVNKFRTSLRTLKNSITFNAPIIDVTPGRGQEDVEQGDLDLASYICIGEYEKNNMKDLLMSVVEDAALKTFSLVSVLPNDDAGDDDERITKIQLFDPLDTFYDDEDMCKAEMVVVSSAERKRYLASQGYVNLNKVQPTLTRSHSVLKNEYEKTEGTPVDADMCLIDQVFYMDYDEDEMGNIKQGEAGKALKGKVVHFVKCGDQIIQEPEELKGYDDLGDLFFLYAMEKNKHVRYPSPWMTDVVPLQRSLNDASENMDTLSHWYNKVRLLQNKADGNTIQMFEDKHVQKISWEGNKPEIALPPPVPQELFTMQSVREQQIEDQVGMHNASMGKVVSAGASGRLQALAQASDMDNVSEPVSNLQTFLERIFARVLEIASQNVTKGVRIYGGDSATSILAIGEKAYETLSDDEKPKHKVIRKFHNVRATLAPGNSMSEMQAKQELLEILPITLQNGMKVEGEAMFKVLMRQYSFGRMRDMAKAIENKTEEIQEQEADAKIMEFEMVKLAKGEQVTATPEQNHELHIQFKLSALKGIIDKYGKDSDVVKIVMDNILQHEAMMKSPPTQMPPGGAPPMPPDQQPAPAAP